ncbi:hypothetical protein Tco_1110379 [Tanacetum coccineum]|uniref:Zinc finger, CCHC-type, retrotransposon Gag domain protein n=1 Tax=Tanacetum coccineum TaxID=301880 RepID=A0ABQ5IIL6_9ASTR
MSEVNSAAAVQAAVDAMLPQIREQVREEYRAGASGSNTPPVTIHTWLERFNKQKPLRGTRCWWKRPISSQKRRCVGPYFDLAAFTRAVLSQFFPLKPTRALERESTTFHRQRASENILSTCKCFLRLAGFLDMAAMHLQKTGEELSLGHKSGDRYQSATQQNSYRGHDQKNDRQGSDRQGGGGNYRNNNNNNYSRDNNRNSGAGRDQRNRGQQSHRSTNSGSPAARVPSKVLLHPVCNTVDVDTQEGSVVLLVLASYVPRLSSSAGLAEETLVLIRLSEFIYHGSLPGKPMKIIPLKSSVVPTIAVAVKDVFPEELPGIPPIRDVEFNIESLPELSHPQKLPYPHGTD